MNISTKSVAYYLISKGFDIFTGSEENMFLIKIHICDTCSSPWYMDLTECFLCGSYNPFLFYCDSCNSYFSITGTVKKCRSCNTDLIQSCINNTCPSNVDANIKQAVNNKYRGVFNKDSCLNVAQIHCINCGGTNNKYITKKIRVVTTDKPGDVKNALQDCTGKDFDLVIVKIVTGGNISYITLNNTEISIDKPEKSIKNTIDLTKLL